MLLIPQKKVAYNDGNDEKKQRRRRRAIMTMKSRRIGTVETKKDPTLVATTVNERVAVGAVVRVPPIEERLVVLALPAAAQHERPVPQAIIKTVLVTIRAEVQVHQVHKALLPRAIRLTSKLLQMQVQGAPRRNVIILALPCHLLRESRR